MEEDWVVLCQALHQLSGEERTKMGVKKALCTLRCPIMESFRRMGFQEGRGVHSASRPLSESADMSRSAEERIYDLFVNQRYAECHSIDTMSDGSISPDYVAAS